MAEQPPSKPYRIEQGPYEGSIEAFAQPDVSGVLDLTREAMRLAETAINGGTDPERKPLVAQPGEVHGPDGETLSLEAAVALISIEIVKQRMHAVEISQVLEDAAK